MKSLLIKDTTKEERQQIVNESLGITSGTCEDCPESLIEMYDDYIYGKREIAEINASFKANYVADDVGPEPTGGCMFMG